LVFFANLMTVVLYIRQGYARSYYVMQITLFSRMR
jgi:hypothetical protein